MKRKLRILCLLLSLTLLTACGSAETVGKGADGAESGNAGSVEKSLNAAPAPVDTSDIENNGGNYVRVGGKVYFRKYGPAALETLAMFGEFAEEWSATGGASEIMAYDLTTKRVESVFEDTGYGGLYAGDGWLYLQERVNGANYVTRYGLDGIQSEIIAEGKLLGLTDGGLLALEQNDAFLFYRDGKEIGRYASETPLLFAGLSDDGLFLVSSEYVGETDEGGDLQCALWQLSPDADALLSLGVLPETDFMFSVEPEQFIETENQIGVAIGYYAGTGHFLNDFAALTATPGVENSLAMLDASAPDPESDEYSLPKLALDDAGNIAVVPYLYGDLRVGWQEEDNGDLQLYDGFQWVTLRKGFCPYRTDGAGYANITQSMECVDGAAYVTFAAAYASPLDDIGWRSAYSLLDMFYWVVPASEGEARELASVEYDTTLVGNVWFQDGLRSLLWQQSAMDPDAWNPEADFAFLIPIAPDAVWDDRDAILLDAVSAQPEGAAEYYGYPVPDTQGQLLCLRLNRDGEAVYLTRTAPDALLAIDVGVTEAELSDAAQKIELTRRPSDEDTPQYWTRLTALQNGVTVLIERTPEQESETEEVAMQEGLFVPGSTLFRRVLNEGESVGLYASLPWHPEIRVAAMRGGNYGEYIFGEDNYLLEEPVNGRYAQKTLAGYPLEDDGVNGHWLYRDVLSKEHTVRLDFFDDDNTLAVVRENDLYWLKWSMDRLHAEEWETPDLLCLETTEELRTLNGLNIGDSAGDYYVERFETDGETILHLSQVNNGDAALDMLIPHQAQWMTEFVFHRYTGVSTPAAPLRNIVLTAEIVKTDAAQNVVWLQEAEAKYELDDMTPTYRAKPYATCCACPLASPTLLDAFAQCPDTEYPMATFQVTIDRDGFVTAFDAP